jgi:hypothetical protein
MKNGYSTHHGMTATECLSKIKELEKESQHLLYQGISGDEYLLRGEPAPPSDLDEKRWRIADEVTELKLAAARLKAKDAKRVVISSVS